MNKGRVNNLTLGWAAVLLLFSVFFSSESKSETIIEWDLRGNDLYYVITSASAPWGNAWIDCGVWFTRSECFVWLQVGNDLMKYVQWKDYQDSLRNRMYSKDIVEHWNRTSMPRSGVIYNWLDHVANGRKCILIYVSGDRRSATELVGDSCTGTITPPPTEPPLPPLSCTINGDINLAHGVLNQDNVNGNTKSVYARVSCNREATVKVTARANNGGDVVTLRSDGSLKSKLQVNNIAGATGVTVRVPGSNSVSVLFSSTLSSDSHVAAGNFSASAIAVLAIQ
ncbi:hypothetical protein [Serratia plymuthica]|uniref:MrpH family fimbial adhesin n=1 Tax=Serratia TaxID=613 RepID=UPI000791A6C2|nr:hypothetical protein [Serratia plymuthica]KYG17279.1 hypothetical protein SOD10_17050 [Serratia plymuthica]NIC28704.1 hypothetical protein [Serratia plymuthica]QPS86254.1 hypothetical protein I6G46_19155 [Serratia plymuthica]QQT83978.1 hypothetical protein I6I95_09160 [Serratia plymuthica]UJE01638.1 hypothetical protein FS592_24860 [Serratia plymuthica]